ncbi:MAG: hypothetical protein GXP49_16725 [Deltaproteobacteria bacterium]|nr:hypothetical protein [Deltaproteobacteria bacterium]
MSNPVTGLGAMVRKRPGLFLAILGSVVVLVSTHDMLSGRLDQSGDQTYHLQCEGQTALAISEGRNPFGPISMDFGTPMLKFYQPLFYLITGSLHAWLGIDLLLLHNLLICLLFAAIPLALWRGYLSLGLPEPAAGLGALLTLISVAGFGTSYESFFTTGVITQALAGVFFPLFLGRFARMLRGKCGPFGAAALFALTFVAHAMVAVYAVLAAVLLFVIERWDLHRTWRSLAIFSVLSILLTAFWLVPFLQHRLRHRPVPDVIALPNYASWSTGLSPGQATRLLFSGRLLDDARTTDRSRQTADDKLINRINISGTLVERPPVLTVLTLLGLFMCLRRWRFTGHRFMVAGFTLSFLMLMGPDDVGWLSYLPFAQRIQFFRCVYLLEFFAFGLAGTGLFELGKEAGLIAHRMGHTAGRITTITGLVLGAAAFILFLVHVTTLAGTHVNPGSKRTFQRAYSIARPASMGSPLRIVLDHGHFRTDKRRLSYMASKGQHTVCGHWRLLGPTLCSMLCNRMRRPGRYLALARHIGIGYYLVNRKRAGRLNKLQESDGTPSMEQVKRGWGSYLYHDKFATYAWTAVKTILVVADDTQWFYTGEAWIARFTGKGATPPTPYRMVPGSHLDQAVLAPADAVWVLDPGQLGQQDLEALKVFTARGRPVFSVSPLEGIPAKVAGLDKISLIDSVPGGRSDAVVEVKEQHIAGPDVYRVQTSDPELLVVPVFAASGWNATVDGKPAPVVAAGPDMVATILPAGEHVVRIFWETPAGESLLDLASILTWCFLAGFGIWQTTRTWRKQ